MQFFIFGKNFQQTAKILHDKHVLKLCIELCQILLIVVSLLLKEESVILAFAVICETLHNIKQSIILDYLTIKKKGYTNHPFVNYAKSNINNSEKLYNLAEEYYKEANIRFNSKGEKKYQKTQYMLKIIHTFIFKGYVLCESKTAWSESVPSINNIPPICASEETVVKYNTLLSHPDLNNFDFNFIIQYGPGSRAYKALTWKDYYLFQQFAYYLENKGTGMYLHTDIPLLLSEGPVLNRHINESLDRHNKIKRNCPSKIFYHELYQEFLNQIEEKSILQQEEDILLMNYLLELSKKIDN